MVGWQWPACPDAHHIRQPCDASVRCKTERRRSKLQIEPSRSVATRSPASPLHLCSDTRPFRELGSASRRERGCQYVSISVVAVSLKKKSLTQMILHLTLDYTHIH